MKGNDYQQVYELLNMMICLMRHPLVAFDLYAQDILTRLIGELYCSYSWLGMKKIDKLLQQLNYELKNPTGAAGSQASATRVQRLIDSLNGFIKNTPLQSSQAELATGLIYSYPLAFNSTLLKQTIDQLFVHSMRMMCMLACVIDEAALPSVLTVNLSAGSTANTSTSQVSFRNL